MRLEAIRGTPRIVFYLGLVGLLFLLLVISGKLNEPVQNKKIVDTKIDSAQTRTLEEVDKGGGSKKTADEESSSSSSGTSTNSSISTKISVSVNSSSSDGETTGSAKVEVTNDGNTFDFSDIFEECFSDGEIKIKIGDTKIDCGSEDGNFEVDWNSKIKHNEKSKYSSETNVSEKNSND